MSSTRFPRALLVAAIVVFAGTSTAWAQNGDATVNYEVQAVTLLNVSGSATLVISAGTAGVGLTDATDPTGVTYAITNNGGADSKKILGKINSNMPANTTLIVTASAPTGGASVSDVTLTNVDQDLVNDIDNVAEGSIAVAFRLQATVAAGIISSTTKTFTMTVTAEN